MCSFAILARSRALPPRWASRLLVALLALVLGSGWPSLAGAEPPIVLESTTDVAGYPMVVVQTAIEDQRRQPVPGLTVDDVTVVEEGRDIQPDTVSMLKDSPTPLALLLAVDTSLSMVEDGRLEGTKEGIKAIIARLRPIDQAGLVRFDTSFALANPFTRDKVVLTQNLDRLTADGSRRLYDGAYLAISEAARVTGNQSVLLITSGDDVQSHVSLGTIKNLAADTGIKLSIIGVGGQVRDEVLESLAKGSGGRYYRAPRGADLPAVLKAAYDDFGGRYEIVYTARGSEALSGDRVVSQLTVAAPGGSTTAAVAYRLPRAGTGVPVAVTRRTVPLQPVPPRPVRAPLPDTWLVAASLMTAFGIVLATLGAVTHQRRTGRELRLRSFVSSVIRYSDDEPSPSLVNLLGAVVVRGLASIIVRVLPPHQVRQTSRRLILAGSPFNWRVSHFLACKALAAGAGLVLGLLMPVQGALATVLLPILLLVIGFMLPDFWLGSQVRHRQRQVVKALPNALDLLAISVEAGLSLDAAMLEVVHKWNNPLSDEFSNVLADLKVGKSRREALRGLIHRTDVAEVATFVSALIQADEVGLSIGRTLAGQAEQIRLRRRQRAERLAREASVKMLFPLALLIFPAIFVVILVPAIPTIMNSLRSLGG
ncbi:MAG: type II secretion system F family protein [Chloroflexi bacterium]|nr:type II secretion system F family protein [Chloroflexota bacterium]